MRAATGPTKGVNRGSAVQSHKGRNRRQEKAIPSSWNEMCNLVAPGKPTEFSLKELVDMVQAHYRPKQSAIGQRFTFNAQVQDRETFADFVADLRRLTEHCDFGAMLNNMLRDRIVCGIRDASLQRRSRKSQVFSPNQVYLALIRFISPKSDI